METDSNDQTINLDQQPSPIGLEIDSSDDENDGARTETFTEISPENEKKCKTTLFVCLMCLLIKMVIVPN